MSEFIAVLIIVFPFAGAWLTGRVLRRRDERRKAARA